MKKWCNTFIQPRPAQDSTIWFGCIVNTQVQTCIWKKLKLAKNQLNLFKLVQAPQKKHLSSSLGFVLNLVSIMFYYIISTTNQKIGELFCFVISLDFRTVCRGSDMSLEFKFCFTPLINVYLVNNKTDWIAKFQSCKIWWQD